MEIFTSTGASLRFTLSGEMSEKAKVRSEKRFVKREETLYLMKAEMQSGRYNDLLASM